MKLLVSLGLLLITLLVGCGTPPMTSAYSPSDEEGISSRGVDQHDYQLVVEKMVSSMLKKGIQTKAGQKPVITLGPIMNRTPHNVEVRMLGELIRVEVLKSGQVKFSTATDFEHKGGESTALYKQLEFQNESGHVAAGVAKQYGQIVGADYIMFGNIYNIERRSRGKTEANFTFNMTLTEVKTGLAVWADTKPIRKNID